MPRFSTLSRRTLLRGAQAAVALPVLEAMLNSHGTAFANGTAFPKRFVVWFFGNGVRKDRWTPKSTGTGWQLSEELGPLTDQARGIDLKDYVNVVSGYDVKTPNGRGHHNGVAAMCSGAPFIPLPPGGAPYSSKFGMKSIDQVIADAIGKDSTFPSLQLAVSKRYTTGEGPTLQYLSHRGPDSPMNQLVNPATLYTNLFGNFAPKDSTDPRDKLRVSVLDVVKDDVNRLRGKLGSADQKRLDAHLTGISEVRQRILALPPMQTSACKLPAKVTATNADSGGSEPIETTSSLMSDLLAMAFACDLTRVATFQFSGSVGGHVFTNLSNEPGKNSRGNEHAMTHEAALQELVHESVVFTMKNFAYTLQAFKKIGEGTGNILDNSCVLCTTDVAEGIAHSIDDYPILVAGRAGGALKYPGVHLRGKGENTTNVLLTCLRATIGPTVTEAGKDEGYTKTPCTGIEA
jgi:Protein of unknown function (DUF1552)